MIRLLSIGLVLLGLLQSVLAKKYQEAPELGEIFKAGGVSGTFVLFDREAETILVWNEANGATLKDRAVLD